MNLTEIIPGLFLVPAENNGRFPLAHSYLVEGTTRALIDTGCGARAIDALRREREIDCVIASHSHPDHTALNWKFDGTPIYAPQYAADTFGNFDSLGERFAGRELASEWRTWVGAAMNFKTALPTHTFGDGHIFDFGKIKLTALHTPGHTRDHMCLFEPTHGVLLSFDIDLTSFGPWYAHLESDIAAFEDSICQVMSLNPRVLVSSHKGIFTDDIPARLQRYLDVIAARDRMLRDLLMRMETLDDLIDLSPFYHGYPYAPSIMRYWEAQMITKHLDRLGVVLPQRSE
jgi:glyoxylase-like metal-dependent hydrolase (beta-lactamase superfamily II)